MVTQTFSAIAGAINRRPKLVAAGFSLAGAILIMPAALALAGQLDAWLKHKIKKAQGARARTRHLTSENYFHGKKQEFFLMYYGRYPS